MARWLVMNGSPRINGTCARVARMLKLLIVQDDPDADIEELEVARLAVEGCNGCDYCRTADDCIMQDDMDQVLDAMDSADCIVLVAPIYFAGLPSQTKAILDRLQPYYWRYVQRREEGKPLPEKRPMKLYVVGDGGDPHGCAPLVASTRSAFAVAGFRIDGAVELIGLKRIAPSDLRWEGGVR